MINRLRVNSFFGCISLKTGGRVIAIFHAVLALLIVIYCLVVFKVLVDSQNEMPPAEQMDTSDNGGEVDLLEFIEEPAPGDFHDIMDETTKLPLFNIELLLLGENVQSYYNSQYFVVSLWILFRISSHWWSLHVCIRFDRYRSGDALRQWNIRGKIYSTIKIIFA